MYGLNILKVTILVAAMSLGLLACNSPARKPTLEQTPSRSAELDPQAWVPASPSVAGWYRQTDGLNRLRLALTLDQVQASWQLHEKWHHAFPESVEDLLEEGCIFYVPAAESGQPMNIQEWDGTPPSPSGALGLAIGPKYISLGIAETSATEGFQGTFEQEPWPLVPPGMLEAESYGQVQAELFVQMSRNLVKHYADWNGRLPENRMELLQGLQMATLIEEAPREVPPAGIVRAELCWHPEMLRVQRRVTLPDGRSRVSYQQVAFESSTGLVTWDPIRDNSTISAAEEAGYVRLLAADFAVGGAPPWSPN